MIEPRAHPHPNVPTVKSLTTYFGGFRSRPTLLQVRKYMGGECAHLALALACLMPGSQLWKMGSGHFAVEALDGAFWDVRGRMSLEQVWEGLNGAQMIPLDRAGVIAELDRGIYGDGFHAPTREKRARQLLQEWLPADAHPAHRPAARMR